MILRYKQSTDGARCHSNYRNLIVHHPCGMAKDVISGLTDNDHQQRLANEPSRWGKRRFWRYVQLLVLATFLCWFWLWITTPSLSLRQITVLPFDHAPDLRLPKSFLRTWAQYAPYIPVAKYVPPPPGCAISQVSTH